ncbi:hypothetical protein FIBSPDRAFT_851462 [Athelia psychrophila]|uniref:DUF6593 domain-containing protein n=1 Tax=Athelia psychrophila TaxID=1759441 RepID=A0A166SHV8_9AGAM|nr:hypothetical protein FIBSPDRAFT_851462 [Fibularhizoctonia sp. CBS 109695]
MDSEGYIIYDIKTVFQGDTNYTAIRDEHDEIIATLRWRDLFADEIMLSGQSGFSSVRKWLKKSMVPMNYNVKLQDEKGRGYIWQGNAPGMTLQLFTKEDRTTPIATFRRSRLIGSPGGGRAVRVRPAIELTSRGNEVRDLAIISWVCLEKSRRTEHGNMSNREVAGAAA